MNISQSTVVLRHFASLSVHHYILGHTPTPRALDLPLVSLTLDLVVDPHELSYWGISPPAGSAGIFILASFGFGPLDQIIHPVSFSLV